MIFHACRQHPVFGWAGSSDFLLFLFIQFLSFQSVYMMDLTHSDALWNGVWPGHLAMGCFCFNIIRFINQPLYLQTFSLLPHALSLLLDSNSTDMRTSDIIPPFYFLLCSIHFSCALLQTKGISIHLSSRVHWTLYHLHFLLLY